MLAPALVSAQGTAALTIFYSARRHGNLEPCGCHVTAQGGLAQEVPVYAARPLDVPDIRVDAGEWMEPMSAASPVAAMQSRYELLGLEKLHYDAVNMALTDLLLRHQYIEFFARQHAKAAEALVSANVYLRDKPDQRAFKPYVIVERKLGDGKVHKIAITGVTDANRPVYGLEKADSAKNPGVVAFTPGYAIKDPVASLKSLMPSLQRRADMVLVLHGGDFNGAKALAEAVTEITFMVTTATPPDRVSPHFLAGANILFVVSPSGRQIGITTLRARAGGWEFQSRPQMLDVKVTPIPDPGLGKIVADFNKVSGKDAVTTHTALTRAYAGAHRCIPCHAQIYKSWKTTPHARTMEKPVIEGEQFNPERLRRATTGHGRPGGFQHPRHVQSQLLMNVQCEACHGPSIGHVEAETRSRQPNPTPDEKASVEAEVRRTMPPGKVPEATCLQCHDKSFSPNFDFATDYAKVKH